MQSIASVIVLFSILVPSKTWYAANQPIDIKVGAADTTLVLMDFHGKVIEPSSPVKVAQDQSTDIKKSWPVLSQSGTYILLAVPQGKSNSQFVGTPLVIEVRQAGAGEAPGPMAVKVVPLSYAVMNTDKGDVTMAFYYDVAPNTVDNFLSLAQGGYYDGLGFHRIISGFMIQGGDPRGDGTGGPGYHIGQEFNSRKHEEGVLSMARTQDPNSAGSQFFICLDYKQTHQLDGQYTAFGKVTDGMEIVRRIGATPTDPATDRPREPQVMKSVKVMPVTADKNPYAAMLHLK
ncbi:MAG TPA: peptidylprolyl isomerase [Tepidisphaeraceae bacterium]|nr:peptidylprolyl isomerase [Tepidisphaeraceae bacterium]